MTTTNTTALAHASDGCRAVLATLVCGALACASLAPAREYKQQPSPIYTWERAASGEGSTGAAAAGDTAASHWRFVPLSPAPRPFPTDAEFLELAERCAAAAVESEIDGALLTCLAERGFYRAECSDGIDNDGDGASDYGDDPGCAEPHALSESPECDDDRDNDGDGLADWDGGGFTHPDPQCVDTPAGNREAEPLKRRGLNPF